MEQPPKFSVRPPKPVARPQRKAFPQPAFKGAASDLKVMFTGMDRRRWLFLALAIAITFAIGAGFMVDSDLRKLGPGPQLIYAENWSENRTDAQIKAQQKIDQAKRHKAEEERRRQYQRLANQLGIE